MSEVLKTTKIKYEDLPIDSSYVNGRIVIKEYKGKQILFCDFRNLHGDDFAEHLINLYEWLQTIEFQPHTFLGLISTEGMLINSRLMPHLNRLGKEIVFPSSKKTAITGLKSVQTVFVRAINSKNNIDMKIFKSEEAALDWLVE